MAIHILIDRGNGFYTAIRSELESPMENPLTEHEIIINELYLKIKELENHASNSIKIK